MSCFYLDDNYYHSLTRFQIVKSILLKHNWNEERARDELISFDPEQQDTNNSLKNLQNHSRILNGQAHTGNVAKVNGSQNKPKVPRTKRRCSDSESNDSEHDEKDHRPRQEKLFDRYILYYI